MTKYRFRYYLYKIFQFFFRYTPNIIIKYFLLLLARLLFIFNKEHLFIADVNLTLAYKNKLTKKEKNNIIYNSYKSLMYNLFEYMENQYISKEELLNKATITNEKVILDAIKEKRKIIFVTAHYGGWELAIPYIALKYGTLAVVNKKMKNEYINNMYVKARDRNNIIMLDKKVAAKGMIKAFKNDHFVAIAIDQNTDNGIEIDFFNTLAMATDAPARLALKFDAVIIPIFAINKGFRKYELKIYNAIDSKNFEYKIENKLEELTQAQHSIIEEQIRDIPEQWFWQHKRWKHHNPKLYESKYD